MTDVFSCCAFDRLRLSIGIVVHKVDDTFVCATFGYPTVSARAVPLFRKKIDCVVKG